MSKRGSVDSDDEPPVSRFRVPDDSSPVIQPAQNITLRNHTCIRCVPVVSPVAEPPLEETENEARQSQTGDQTMEPVTGKQVEEQATNQEERVKENEETVTENRKEKHGLGNDVEELTTKSKIKKIIKGCEEEEIAKGSGPRNNSPQLSKSEIIAALRRNALLLRTEPALPKEDILKERHFVVSPLFKRLESLNEKLSFSVVSYNISAEPETEIGGSGSGFGRKIAKSSTGRAGTDHLPSNYNERIIIELFYLEPDIFCLQAVEKKYWYKLEKILNNWGYAGAMKRRRLPGSRDCCESIFFRISRFELITSSGIYLDDLIVQHSMHSDVTYNPGLRQSVESREVAIFMTLRCRVTDRKVTVASMRCLPEHKNRPDLQAAQVCCVVQRLAGVRANSGDRMPSILCGDLDFQPTSGPYQVLRDGLISEDTEQSFNKIESLVGRDGERCPLSTVDRAVFRHPMPNIRSAYGKVFGSEPPNVWKRESETFVCSSYVWFDESQLKLVGALDMVDSKAVTGSGIPNEFFPSGSLSLKASFQFCEDMPGTG